ncbi:MAG: hypothetical protein RI995_309 [Bacteroidota bacterium]
MVVGSSFLILLILIGLMAFLYASVGHGGASGYLAVLAIFAIQPVLMKQSALVLNLTVSLYAAYSFFQKGHFKWRNFWPFAIASIPAAYVGAQWPLADSTYKKVLGFCLLISVVRILFQWKEKEQTKQVPIWAGLLVGAIIGLLSGMIGIGGGIILSPVMLLFNWATLKETAAVSALFILVNSLSGLLGLKAWVSYDQYDLIYLVLFATIGGVLGARWGANKASPFWLKIVLGLVLVVAAGKLVFV